MIVKKFKLILVILLNIILFASCSEKIEESSNIQKLNGEIFIAYWEGNKFTKSDFYRDDSKDSILFVNNNFFRPPKNLKIDIIDKSKMKGKSVLEVINDIKSNFVIKEQSIYFYNKNDTLKLIGLFLNFEVPHYLDMVNILFYFDEEYNLGDKRSYFRNEILSDSSEIKRISNILANEYKYEILQRTFISSKE